MNVTLIREGPKSYSLSRTTNVLTVTRSVLVREVSLVRSSVVVNIYQQGSGSTGYQHLQTSPATLWTVQHNLGYRPGGIVVKDTAGSQWLYEVDHLDASTLTLSFGIFSFSGTAYIS